MRNLDVTILNWNKFQLRKQIKNPSWFRLQHSFWNDGQFFHFTAEERWVWVCLLSIASKKQSPHISFSLEWLSQESRVGLQTIESALEKLAGNECVTYTLRDRNLPVTTLLLTWDTTEQNITEQDISLIETKTKVLSPPKDLFWGKRLVGEYVSAYEKRYGTRPVLTKKTTGMMKRFADEHGTESQIVWACAMVRAYLHMDDAWFIKKNHDFGTFLENLNKISVFLESDIEYSSTTVNKYIWLEEHKNE